MLHPAPRIFISVAEPSADLHAGSLIQAVRARVPEADFVGVAGPRMVDRGCTSLFDMTSHSTMLAGVVSNVGRALRMFSLVDRTLGSQPFDAAVVVDSPTLHLPMARRLKARGIPVLYFIAPQTWAWAEYRVGQIRRQTDRLAVILPFEEAYFQGHGCEATYVGHPLFDVLTKRRQDPSFGSQIPADAGPIITILPGSRKHVVTEVFPGQIEVARRIKRRFRKAHFLVSVANPQTAGIIDGLIAKAGMSFDLHTGRNVDLITAADLVLVASGTATLETAYYHKPMIVMYNSSRVGYQLIGRWLISTKFFSLVNILAGRELVPEFMPYYRSPTPIAEKAIEMLNNPTGLEKTANALRELIQPLVKPAPRKTPRRSCWRCWGTGGKFQKPGALAAGAASGSRNRDRAATRWISWRTRRFMLSDRSALDGCTTRWERFSASRFSWTRRCGMSDRWPWTGSSRSDSRITRSTATRRTW